MSQRGWSRAVAVAVCAMVATAAASACKSSNASGTGDSSGTTVAAGSGGGGSGGGGKICPLLSRSDAAALFTVPIKDGQEGTWTDPNQGAECKFALASDNDLGLQVVRNPDIPFWKNQFSEQTPVAGVGDTAWYANNGLVLFAQKGSAGCAVEVTVSQVSQVNAKTAGTGIDPSDRDAFARRLGAFCTKLLG